MNEGYAESKQKVEKGVKKGVKSWKKVWNCWFGGISNGKPMQTIYIPWALK